MEENTGSIGVHDVSMSDIDIMLDMVFSDERDIPQVVLKIWTREDGKQYAVAKVKSSKRPRRKLYGIAFLVWETNYFSEEITKAEMDAWVTVWNNRHTSPNKLFQIKYV
tara:strand:- start:14 stop:340 length:327 start_codon:yes stop_codon:yes gene_type:complete